MNSSDDGYFEPDSFSDDGYCELGGFRPYSINSEAMELGNRLLKDLRPSDLRYEGTHLLAEHIVQAGKMFQQVQWAAEENKSMIEALGVQKTELTNLADEMSEMMITARQNIKESTQTQIDVLNQAHKELLKILHTKQAKIQALENDLNEKQTNLSEERNALNREREEFNSLGFWARITKRI